MSKDYLDTKVMFGPLMARMLSEGANPIDIERVCQKMDPIKLSDSWELEWSRIASNYERMAEEAESKGNKISARELYWLATISFRAGSLAHFRDLERRKQLVFKYVECYQKSASYYDPPMERVEIPFRGTSIPGYLHMAKKGRNKHPCSILFGGIDGGKEESHAFARRLVEAGISALAIDLPGCGEAIFSRGIALRIQNVLEALSNAVTYLSQNNEIDGDNIGVQGGCLGANYAYQIAASDERVKFCVLWMPMLSLSFIDKRIVPAWMQEGPWMSYVTALDDLRVFRDEMSLDIEKQIIRCPLYIIHAIHDNWMPTDYIKEVFNRAKGSKELLLIEEEPVFTSGSIVTHTVPVVEQMHWIKHLIADWVSEKVCN